MDITYFEKLWNKKISSFEDVQKFWDLRADEFNVNIYRGEGGKRFKAVFNLLESKNIINENSKVLDIGCGPGKYALEFARRVKWAAGVDISPRMINYAKENAAEEKLQNVSFSIEPWDNLCLEDHGWAKEFDLVFASMCPGINSSDTLLKMCRASKGFCFMSGFVQRRDTLMEELQRFIYGSVPDRQWGKSVYCAFNILWLSGYHPEIIYYDTEWEHTWTLEKAFEIYRHRLKTKNRTDSMIDNKILDFLSKSNTNGTVKENVRAKIAWMYWKVH